MDRHSHATHRLKHHLKRMKWRKDRRSARQQLHMIANGVEEVA